MSTDSVNERSTSDSDSADETDVAEVHDIVQEDDDFVETAEDVVEDVRSESVVINHFRV